MTTNEAPQTEGSDRIATPIPIVSAYLHQTDPAAIDAARELLRQIPRPGMTPAGLANSRKMVLDYSPKSARAEVMSVASPAGDVPVRVIRPDGPVAGVQITFHPGGLCLGAPVQDDPQNELLATELGLVGVSVDYRLAPENPHPAALQDGLAAACWAAEHHEQLGSDRLILGGSSAGAYLAAQVLLVLRDEHPDIASRVAAAYMSYGGYDLGEPPSLRRGNDSPVVTPEFFRLIMSSAFPGLDRDARQDPSLSPLFAELSGLPPVLLSVGTADPYLDDSMFFAARLRAAGVQADLDLWQDCDHGFDMYDQKAGEAFRGRLVSWLRTKL